MVIIFIHNLQNGKSCKVIVHYLAEISQLKHLTISAKQHMVITTCQAQQETVLKKTLQEVEVKLEVKGETGGLENEGYCSNLIASWN